MYQLERIVLHNWGRLATQDIEVRGVTAILGPTGTGKSTIIDALQVIVTGGNRRFYDLNKSTGGHNSRTIRDYCLGADDHISPGKPDREAADTLIGLVFRDRTTGVPISIGLVISARLDEAGHNVRARFVAPGYALLLEHLLETREEGRQFVPNATRLIGRLKELCPKIRLHGGAMSYAEDYLHVMRPRGAAPDARQVLRNFKESVAFQPIEDPTQFVRKHILEEDDIDVEALKGSIERYRYLEQEVRKREEQLAEVAEARRRMQVWAQHQIRHNVLRFTSAHAERRRLEIVNDRIHADRDAIAKEVEREGAIKRRHEDSIRQLTDDVLRLRSLRAEAPAAAQLRGLDAERAAALDRQENARTTVQRRIGQLSRFAGLAAVPSRVPFAFKDSVDAATELVTLARGRTPDALEPFDKDLCALEQRIVRLTGAEQGFNQQADSLALDISGVRERIGELGQSLEASTDGPLLSPQVREFMSRLTREGITPTPLPDLVEVTEPAWAMALEMLLGPYREALLVPAHQLSDAFGLLYRDRHELHTCRLVDTRKTRRWSGELPAGSIASIIDTQSEDARAFIERQVGRFVRAETDADLERLDQAVTKRGKTTAGMGLRVYRDLVPILGKTAQRAALEQAREELAKLSQELADKQRERDLLREIVAAIGIIREDAPDALAAALGSLADAGAALRGNAQARSQIESPEMRQLESEIGAIEADIAGYCQEIEQEIEPRLKELKQNDLDLQVKLGVNMNALAKSQTEEEETEALEGKEPLAALLELLPQSERTASARHRVSVLVELPPEGRDPAALLADAVAEAKREADPLPRLAEESVRRGRTAYMQFVSAYLDTQPLSEANDAAILRWCQTKERQLEEDELRQYRQAFEEARIKMEADLTEGLINRLSDKFQKARAQIERLNRNLAGRHFTGQTYAFRYHVNAAMKPIHALAEAIAKAPQKGLALLEEGNLDPQVRQGFRELERRLSDEELVKDLQDYRRFFDFDLHMTNDRGEETTLSKRAVTGSGGQKQAPYYVAVGAAMAAAYYPKSVHDEPDGLGLVVFDEAFNNLDAPNTRALLQFFADLHLQVVVAAPDKVRAMFLENVDTILSVNRRPDTQDPIVTVTYPQPQAREALAEANPVNRGVEAFRPISQAAAAE